ncbi:MAG TPA: Flp pilus assembly protein CpaB, partial [Gammaproteobacteria bacterium]
NYKSETLLEDVKVLAVDQTASPEKDKPVIVRAVTLELSSHEAEKLVQATQEGTVQLALRNPLDDSKKQQEQEVAKATPPRKATISKTTNLPKPITVIRGTKVTTSQVKL